MWDKIIKKQIYLKALNFIGEELYNSKIIQREDHIITFALYKVANKYMRINNYGYLKIAHKNQTSSNIYTQNNHLVLDEFTFLEFLYNNTRDTKEEKTLFFTEFLLILKLNVCTKVFNNKIKFLVQRVCKISLNSIFILEKNKIKDFCYKFEKINEFNNKQNISKKNKRKH